MTIVRYLLLIALVLTGVSLAQDKPNTDPEKAFKFGDKNKDGKLSREEFRQLLRNGPRFKDNPKIIDLLFDRLDADGDGSLTLAEFKNIVGTPRKKEPMEPVVEKPATSEQIAFFEKKIRPVLIAECFKCHSTEKDSKVRGGLRLDTRDGLRAGGDSGAAIVPGNAGKSLLVKALRHVDDKLVMPPKTKLSATIVADFVKWIDDGAADPRSEKTIAYSEIDIKKGREFWAFQAPKKHSAPKLESTWPRTDVDRFLLASLEKKSLKPVADADRHTLIRRVTFDLTGLPPTPEEIAAFVKDTRDDALSHVVDRLLKSPQYGERFGRHWLDVARYAESSGKQTNFTYPHAWRYRDWVIDAFNADKPYDRFIKEQLAGDLLPAKTNKERAELLIATGFLAIGSKPHNERNLT